MPPTWRSELTRDLRAALPAWLAARVVVLITLFAARYTSFRLHLEQTTWIQRHLEQGILGWDAERYRNIAEFGYAPLPRVELRFFPLLPLLTRVLSFVTRLPEGVALLIIANAAALVLGALVHRLCRREKGDEGLAQRATWVVAFTPVAFVLAWGYSESLWGCLAVATFLCIRSASSGDRRWWIAAGAAFLAGLTRPVSALLSVPTAIEAVRSARGGHERSARDLGARAAAVIAAPLGTAVYLVWVRLSFGDALLPFRIQQTGRFRGNFADPLTPIVKSAAWFFTGHVTHDAIRFPWIVVLVALLVVVFRSWPVSYGAFAFLSLLVALSAERLGSFERYAFAAFPFVLALAVLGRREAVHRATLAIGAGTMTLFGTLALLGGYTP